MSFDPNIERRQPRDDGKSKPITVKPVKWKKTGIADKLKEMASKMKAK